ncbi:MAG TPA: SDR family oxidoreductase [Bryobacteraceae bacterium]|nr:SDR family oxidoreductase [Bryobacteraceae bacterium]
MELGLQGKSAMVLAASKGLGRACAMALAREGANVAIGSRARHPLEQTADEIRHATGAHVISHPVDVTKPDEVRSFFDHAAGAFKRIDILVNNAGGPPFGPFEQFDDDAWHKALELNLMSSVRFTRLALPGMKAAGWGRIINIVSLGTKSVLPGSVLSTAGRLGIIGMAKLLSDEVAPFGITVNNVASGIILTDRVRQTSLKQRMDRGMDEKAALEDLAQTIPAKRVGMPEELAALVAFLASTQAGYITGSTIPVDGGIVRSIL